MQKDHKHLLDVGVEVELDLLEFVEIRIWEKLGELCLILEINGFCSVLLTHIL
jgi:hypothetical protein